MKPWLSIVGIGDDGLAGLGEAARALVESAELLIGGARHLEMLPPDGRKRLTWPSPLNPFLTEIEQRRGQRVCVLATGDPMCYGIGATLVKRIGIEEMIIVPAPSAFSLACARLGWSRCEVETLSLHGRPLALLHSYIQPGAKLLVLSHDRDTPGAVARILCERGFGGSLMTVLEHMNGAAECTKAGKARQWQAQAGADFNTLAIDCVAGSEANWYPRTPGLPDDAFQHDGQMTKREVRAATLAQLMPISGQLLWDVGAGAGSIAIEWLRAAARTRAIAIERDAARAAVLFANAQALGTPQLELQQASAPAALHGLEPPDAVFIGGGLTSEGVFDACWQALRPGGRLVANGVTLESEALLLQLQSRLGGELTRIEISRAVPVGAYHAWRTLMPVTQYAVTKASISQP